jgi:hypothetical protein
LRAAGGEWWVWVPDERCALVGSSNARGELAVAALGSSVDPSSPERCALDTLGSLPCGPWGWVGAGWKGGAPDGAGMHAGGRGRRGTILGFMRTGWERTQAARGLGGFRSGNGVLFRICRALLAGTQRDLQRTARMGARRAPAAARSSQQPRMHARTHAPVAARPPFPVRLRRVVGAPQLCGHLAKVPTGRFGRGCMESTSGAKLTKGISGGGCWGSEVMCIVAGRGTLWEGPKTDQPLT